MTRYLKLVNLEIRRFFSLYLVLMGVVAGIQLFGVIYDAKQYLGWIREEVFKGNMKIDDFLQYYGHISLSDMNTSFWMTSSIMIAVAALLIYTFFIWYRDWYGKNPFIYRLLTLPASRMNLFFAKLTAILSFVFGMLSLQVLLMLLEKQIIRWMIPEQFRIDLSIREAITGTYLQIFYPPSVSDFLLIYGLGTLLVFVFFTAILFERSYRLKGILMGIGFGVLSVFLYLSPIYINSLVLHGYFFTHEVFLLTLVSGLAVLIACVGTSRYLLKRKIRV